MLKSLSLGTDGALKRGLKKALVLGVAGMLFFGGVPTPTTSHSGVGGAGMSQTDIYNKKKANEKALLKITVTIDHVKYTQEKEPNKDVQVKVKNVSTALNENNIRVNVYV